jgi:predicted RNase H-like nuclease (RuvC/YqgF family)
VARLKEEVEHSKRIIHELRSELHTITLRAQTTTESTGRLDAKVVQLNHELDHERALVNRLKDEQLGKKDFHGSTTST